MGWYLDIDTRHLNFTQSGVGIWIVSAISGQLFLAYWLYNVRDDLEKLGITEELPEKWQTLIPGAHFYGIWKLSKGLEVYTRGKLKRVVTFLLVACLFGLGAGVIQDKLNALQRRNEKVHEV